MTAAHRPPETPLSPVPSGSGRTILFGPQSHRKSQESLGNLRKPRFYILFYVFALVRDKSIDDRVADGYSIACHPVNADGVTPLRPP